MLEVLGGFAIVIIVIALGFGVGRARLLGPGAVYTLNMFVFWIALPATLVKFMAGTDIAQLFGVNLAAVALSTIAAGALGFVGYRFIARRSRPDSLIAMLACSYCNGSNLGIPLATHLLDDPTATLPVILFQVGFYGPMSVLLLDMNSGKRTASFLRTTVLSIVRNPLIIGAAVGIAISLLQHNTTWQLPELVKEPITIIANATVGCALIAFGMSMAETRVLQRGHSPRRSVWAASFVKSVVHPLIAVGLGIFIFDATPQLLLIIALVAALPTGQNVFTYAQRFGVNKVLARDTAVVSTALSLPVMAVLMVVLG
ncbi:MAG TPA: AEC family transporter [Candidatus Corynebacterium gallistercoris]|uniref:AEC family transporter n=1 Tax=Candidatus Corynebacterium gallistercoris TaxID=2838530 RepID=A0A9D1RXI4_9CORY|nr:AEC family transporter [Candidatus Corynebacterium gallistercoris]